MGNVCAIQSVSCCLLISRGVYNNTSSMTYILSYGDFLVTLLLYSRYYFKTEKWNCNRGKLKIRSD